MFSLGDVLDLAVQIEKNGEKVYRNALKQVSNASLMSLLEWLADEEVQHARKFADFKQKVGETTDDPELEEMCRNILEGVLGTQAFSLQDADFSTMEGIEDLLKVAIEFEKDTVLFCEMIGNFIEEEETLEHLKVIIEEENLHVRSLQEFLDTGVFDPT